MGAACLLSFTAPLPVPTSFCAWLTPYNLSSLIFGPTLLPSWPLSCLSSSPPEDWVATCRVTRSRRLFFSPHLSLSVSPGFSYAQFTRQPASQVVAGGFAHELERQLDRLISFPVSCFCPSVVALGLRASLPRSNATSRFKQSVLLRCPLCCVALGSRHGFGAKPFHPGRRDAPFPSSFSCRAAVALASVGATRPKCGNAGCRQRRY